MSRPVLATINGEAILAGDLMYSTWHGRAFFASRSHVDGVDGEVYLAVPGGHASLKSCAKYNLGSPCYFDARQDALAWDKGQGTIRKNSTSLLLV